MTEALPGRLDDDGVRPVEVSDRARTAPERTPMGVYVSVRGWLECDGTQLGAVRRIVAAHEDEHYNGGWGMPRRHVNWTCYVFYGADIRESGLEWFAGQVGEMARIPASDEDGDLVRGLFLVSHEIDGTAEWQVRDGRLLVSPADGRHRYLDV
ncbi:hypothetical protein [Streptomyces sp. NPDC093094]|uniref:hypothetical protein n=1 Tax=Streptomyces sp. NPDC093094 TaxID=3366026 RepID=UPI00382DEDC3